MNDFLFHSYLFISVACFALWIDASRRSEYGKRPLVFLVSILFFSFSGIVLFTARALFRDNLQLFLFPLLSLILISYFISFFLLEYSIHIQRAS